MINDRGMGGWHWQRPSPPISFKKYIYKVKNKIYIFFYHWSLPIRASGPVLAYDIK
jgi:hypothetical protein